MAPRKRRIYKIGEIPEYKPSIKAFLSVWVGNNRFRVKLGDLPKDLIGRRIELLAREVKP